MVQIIKLPRKKGKPEGKQCLYDKVRSKFLPKARGSMISADEIVEMLKREIGDYDYIILLADGHYNCLSYDDYIKFLKSDRVNQELWFYHVKEKWGHAINFFITADKQFWCVEPQNDKVFRFDKENWRCIMVKLC